MKAVILAGGLGTRISEESHLKPKPMIEIGGLPILWHIMKYYASWQHSNFVLCLGYKSRVIKDFFLNYEAYTNDFTLTLGGTGARNYHAAHPDSGWAITLAETGMNTMTGGRIAKIRKYVADDEHFFLTYGDGVGDVDIKGLVDFHRSHGKVLTVTGVHPPGRFGELEYGDDRLVTGFNEKPQVSGGRISAGFFVCRRDLFDYLPDDTELVFEQEPIRRIVADGELAVFEHDGFWQPMDTYRDYAFLNQLWDHGRAPWLRW
jgi:glucose-1-phosphate cytidylyltransferase